jgi:hypothetical protein
VCGGGGVDPEALACAFARVALLIQYEMGSHNFICGLPRHFLINGKVFGKKLLKIKCVFLFYLRGLFKTFLILKEFSEILSLM